MVRITAIVATAMWLFLAGGVAAQAMESGHETTMELLVLGADLQYQGLAAEAEEVFAGLVERDPDNVFARNQLALARARQGKFEQALEGFSQVFAVHPENSFSGVWRSVLLLALDRVGEARATLEQILTLDPDNADAMYYLGVIHWAQRDSLEAVRLFLQAQAVNGHSPHTHFRLALAFRSLGMEANARLEIHRTLALDPGHTGALNVLGWMVYTQGDWTGAQTCWQRVVDLDPSNGDARANLARILTWRGLAVVHQGDRDQGLELLQEALAVNPGDRAASYALRTMHQENISTVSSER